MPRRIEMKSNRSLLRVAAVTGVAAFLFSFAHVSPAAAQTTRYARMCTAEVQAGASSANCTVPVPNGKRFVIETVSVGGHVPSAQYTRVDVWTWVNGLEMKYAVPAGSQVLSNAWSWWSGALSSTIFSEGTVRLSFYRQGSNTSHSMRLTVSGYLEDM
jgi:hypothetical protein